MVGGEDAGLPDRHAQLVEAAFNLVAEVGLEGLRLRHVAEAAGIDHSTLHHHVATKQDLVTEVARYATRQFWSTMPAQADPVAQLRGHLDALRALMSQRPALFTVTTELDLRARRDPGVRGPLDEFEAGWRQALRDLVDRGVANGVWSPAEPGDLVELVIATVKGVRLEPATAAAAFDQLAGLLTPANEE